MTTTEVEACIRSNCTWQNLPRNVRQLLGNSQKEYDKLVVEYSVKNQMYYKGNLIRFVKKNEEQYYDLLLNYSRSHLMLFPYHLQKIICRGCRVTPFQYYCNMMQDLMNLERSYDSLPNFTAADCLRLLGIGRNQYIELMNKCRSKKKLFQRKPVVDVLPQKPVPIKIQPWWIVHYGCVMEEDIKAVGEVERRWIDQLIDSKDSGVIAGNMDCRVLQKLYSKGLVYLDVPIADSDLIIVPPLDGFVMNRVLGDYFETLLYKIFVSLDEHTTVKELSDVLQIDLQLVKNAVSVFCRLNFAFKKQTGIDAEDWKSDPSWKSMSGGEKSNDLLEMIEVDEILMNESGISETPDETESLSLSESFTGTPTGSGNAAAAEPRRIGFMFDSTLTAFLMMGNLSASLKNHAVTLFEVGKLTSEGLTDFISELGKVSKICDSEGETQRYFDHAHILRKTILYLRDEGDRELDLLRCESLQSLDAQTRLRVLRKNYRLLISMAPLSNEVTPVNCSIPPHLGPPIAEINSPWFKLFIYQLTGSGPKSLLLGRGTRLRKIPNAFKDCSKLLINSWSHDPGIVNSDTCLPQLNEALQNSCVFLQEYSSDAEVVHIPFPAHSSKLESDPTKDPQSPTKGPQCPTKGPQSPTKGPQSPTKGPLSAHPAVAKLGEKLQLPSTCGYITLLHLPNVEEKISDRREENCQESKSNSKTTTDVLENRHHSLADRQNLSLPVSDASLEESSEDPRKFSSSLSAESDVRYSEWKLFDCAFGIPLFDADLNERVCQRCCLDELLQPSRLESLRNANRLLSILLLDFINTIQPRIHDESSATGDRSVPFPIESLLFENGIVKLWNGK